MKKDLIITIGRRFGSGGKCIAEALGERLGIPVYDNELITKAAQESGFSAEFFERTDEKRSFFSLSAIFSTAYSAETENFMSDKGLFGLQCETIRHIAEKGPAIIVGRCSNYVLRDRRNTLNIFITAPVEDRIGRVAERLGMSEDKAKDFIEAKDKARKEYYDYYTFGNWGEASDYDLCIDSSFLGTDGTVEMIIDFARKAGLI